MAISTHILGAVLLQINTDVVHLYCSKYHSLKRGVSDCPVFSIL
jgi:hypothetical protein